MIRVASAFVVLVFATVSAALAEPPAPVHHDIRLWLDPDQRTLRATTRTTLSGTGPVAVRLAPWLTVSALEVDGKAVTGLQRGGTVDVDPAGGGTSEILIAYEGTVPAAGTENTVGPEGSYLPGGGGWLPFLGGGHVTYRLEMTVPDRHRVIASGRLVDERAEGGRYTAVVTRDHPAEEPSVFAGPYTVRERWHRGIRLRTYFHDELAGLAEDYLDRSAGYLDRFSDRIGDYPFAGFFIVSSPLPVGLGFANVAYVGRTVLPLPFMRGRSLAHEILHNWWGNGVFVDYPSGNWSEGLTTYMADYALAADEGAGAAREMRLQWLRDFAALPPGSDFPVTAFTARTHDAEQVIGYNKVAFIFHMLEREIGTPAFTEAIRAFWNEHRFRVAGWPDLRRAFEAASGRDLAAFFDQWLNRAGAPVLRLSGATREDGAAVATLGQDAPAYRLTVPVAVDTAGGRVDATARLQGLETLVSIATGSPPLAVSVDPDYDLFRRLDPAEMPPILRSVTLDPSAVAVIATNDSDTGADANARQLAARLLGADVRFASLDPPPDGAIPVLLIATGPDSAAAVAAIGAEPPPPSLAGAGTARAWTGRRTGGAPFAVVVADDAKALTATLRALPHHGRASYLTFDGGKVVDKGVWEVKASPLRHTFDAR